MVSVCMATYNGAAFVKEQINSILTQLKSEDELIISDDGSTDGTLDILSEIADDRIRLYHGNFRDVIRNFQHALSKAEGDHIFLADQDDVWLPGKVAKMIDLLQKYDLVISDSEVVDEQLQLLHASFFAYFGSGKGLLKNMARSTYYGSCMAFRKSLLDGALPFPATREIGHDLWIGLVAEMTGTVCFYPEALIKYRRHGETFTSAGTGKSKRGLITKLKGRMIMMKEVIKYYLKYKICKKV
ncbi:glycosyltransferase family 2 protein [Chitinophaga sancti]|uniref:glycosyltransferase family 2 protein n=1 Tax=Chitinophaga sancti TaxID=1004 RepID=UPI002A756794|nr:glycosyltransferase family 2 protein [Chitinophaga sancti]WPQ64531.1 glycosyltransferase family 2 protein [Chitinophaga sancti]